MILPPFDRSFKSEGHCDCECDIDPEYPEDDFYYQRTCEFCGFDAWWTLSCPHEKARSCPGCDELMEVVPFKVTDR